MTIRTAARMAALAILVAELAAGLSQVESPPKPVVWAIFALQVAAIVWITDRRCAAAVREAIPAALAGVGAAAGWTAVAFAAPITATNDLMALLAIVAAALLVVGSSRRRAGQRLLPLLLVAPASAALAIYLSVGWVMPADGRFVSNSHPPVWPPATRLVDPILELAIFLVLALALAADQLRARTYRRRAEAHRTRALQAPGPNEMIVEPADLRLPTHHGDLDGEGLSR